MNIKKLIPLLALLTVAVAGVSYAAIPSANGTITACKDNKGTLKVIDAEAGQSCPGNSQQLSWNQQGPAGVSGYEVVWNESAQNSAEYREVFIQCPPGKDVLGGGGAVYTQYNNSSWIPQDVALVGSMPDYAGDFWLVQGHEVRPTDSSWRLAGFAVCATVS